MNGLTGGVAAVIPTHDRPGLVQRAIQSVRDQTVAVTEIVVVVDEAEAAGTTLAALAEIDDDRLQVVSLPGRNGPSKARNAGVAAARSPWIAFCDDDDWWLPTKIERQVGVLATAGWPEDTVVATGAIARSPAGDQPLPHRFIGDGEPVGDYLFSTRTPLQGETALPTSTLVASRWLLRNEPFDESLWNHEDWDLVIRTPKVMAVRDHLAVLHIEEARPGLTATPGDWDRSLAWAGRRRCLLGDPAYSAFCLTVVAGRARAAGSARGVGRALLAGLRGRPPWRNLAWFPMYAVLPPPARRRLRRVAARWRARGWGKYCPWPLP